MKSVSFSMTDSERTFYAEYARRKGFTLSALAKAALFQYETRHPLKGLSIETYNVDAVAVLQDVSE